MTLSSFSSHNEQVAGTGSAPAWIGIRRGLAVVGLLAGLLAGLLVVNVLYLNYLSGRYQLFGITDFAHHGWLAGRVVLGGGSPYDAQGWLRTHWTPEYEREIGSAYLNGDFVHVFPTRTGEEYNPEHRADFLYPLWMAYFFSPFALLPLSWALALFMLVNEVAVLVGLWLAGKLLRFQPPWYGALLVVLLAFGFRPTFFTLQEGAYSALVLAGLLGAIRLIQQRRWPVLVGALLAFSTIKLQASIIILAFIGLWLLRQRRWSELRWAAGWGLLLWGVPTLLRPGWVGEWLGMTRLVSPTLFAQPTLWSLAVALAGPGWWIVGLGVTLVVAAGLLWRWRTDLVNGTWESLPVTFIVALPPAFYIWEYDQILLLFPWLACWALAAVGNTPAARVWRYGLMAWILLLPLYALLPLPRGDLATYGLLLPATLLPLYLLARRGAARRGAVIG